MKRWLTVLGLLGVMGAGASGCATVINGTAPAAGGGLYAVGSRNNLAQAWTCPGTPSKGECQQIAVQETDK